MNTTPTKCARCGATDCDDQACVDAYEQLELFDGSAYDVSKAPEQLSLFDASIYDVDKG